MVLNTSTHIADAVHLPKKFWTKPCLFFKEFSKSKLIGKS